MDLPTGLVMTSDSGVFLSEPPKPPACNNGVDDDNDGRTDAGDPGCSVNHWERGAICWPDYAWPSSPMPPVCSAPQGDLSEQRSNLACDDGVDNDGDGSIDEVQDPGCQLYLQGGTQWQARKAWAKTLRQPEDPACDDFLDNDGDGGIDWGLDRVGNSDPDSYCENSPWRLAESPPSTWQCPAGQHCDGGCGLGFELVLLAPLLVRLARQRRTAIAKAVAAEDTAP